MSNEAITLVVVSVLLGISLLGNGAMLVMLWIASLVIESPKK